LHDKLMAELSKACTRLGVHVQIFVEFWDC
jgi:hypothetical protein